MKGNPAPIGRDSELDALALAMAKNRVVSLTGAPGVGKSALAAAFAARHRSVYCHLHGVSNADGACRELARSLGLPDVAISSADSARVGRALASRGKVVMVLDDADLARGALEQLVPVWLEAAPLARFLIAARARVNVAHAQRFDVDPLEVPAAREEDPTLIGASAAVRLFVRCAAVARPGYRISPETAPHVAAIVRALAGLPLAIELCAGRVVVLGERDLAKMLEDRLDALDASSGAAGGRTLHGAFAFSWDQLDPGDARALASCSVFRDSFDLEGAAALTNRPRPSAAEALERLEHASLVRAFEPEGLPGARRYRLPESVRFFAAERLSRDELAEATQRHAEHFGATSRDSVRLAFDREDLASALAWAIAEERIAMAARVAMALAPLALSRGPLVPFLESVDALLAHPALEAELAAELHLVRGLARIHHGRRDDALPDLGSARALARESGNLRVEVLATSKTGLIVGMKGDFGGGKAYLAAAAALLVGGDQAALSGVVSKDLANVLSEEGQNAEAMVELSRARDLFHRARDAREEGFVLMMLGSRLLDVGQLEDARRDCTSGLELLRAVRDHRSTAWCQVLLALVDGEQGELRAARTRLDGALLSFRSIGDAQTEGLVLGYLGNVALEQGALQDAEALYRDARLRLAEVGDAASEGMVTAGAALVDLALGRTASARERFAHARALTPVEGRAARRDALAIMEAALGDEAASSHEDATLNTEEVRFARRAVLVVRGHLSPQTARGPAASHAVVVVAPDGAWLRTPGRVAKFGLGGALRGITLLLASDRLRYPGRPIPLGALIRAGWPREAIVAAAVKNRLHVTLARLRNAGLADFLRHEPEGYFLDPSIGVRFAEPDERPEG